MRRSERSRSDQPPSPAVASPTKVAIQARAKPERKRAAVAAGPPRRPARDVARIEKQIEQLEEELGAISARLSQPDAYEDRAALSEDGLRHQSLQEELSYLYREWEMRAG